jgi:hypothetical protein
MSSSENLLRLNIQMTVGSVTVTFLNVLLGDVEGKMAGMFINIWTKLMPGLQAVFVVTQKMLGGRSG